MSEHKPAIGTCQLCQKPGRYGPEIVVYYEGRDDTGAPVHVHAHQSCYWARRQARQAQAE